MLSDPFQPQSMKFISTLAGVPTLQAWIGLTLSAFIVDVVHTPRAEKQDSDTLYWLTTGEGHESLLEVALSHLKKVIF